MQETGYTEEKREQPSRLYPPEKSFYWGRFFIILLLIIGSWHFLFAQRAIVDLTAKVEKSSHFKIYYRTHNQKNWSGRRVKQIYLRPHRENYSFRFVNIKDIAEIRIDPTEKDKSKVSISSLTIRQNNLKPVNLFERDNLQKIKRGIDIEESNFSLQNGRIELVSSGNDPQLFFTLPRVEITDSSFAPALRLILFAVIAFFIAYGHTHFTAEYRFVPGALLIILTLASIVAGVSRYNQHPDEFVHIAAADYYSHNTIPPAVGDKRAEGTYSQYGYSRLFNVNGALSYMLAGKFALFLKPLDIPNYIALRYFNITLLAILFLCTLYSTTWRIIVVPVLLSPQIWYIFSYFNSDALSLVLCLWLAWELVSPNSLWNIFTRDKENDDTPFPLFAFLRLTLLMTMLLFCKMNFYFMGVYTVLFLGWQFFFHRRELTRRTLTSLTSACLITLVLFGSYRIWDEANNDFQKKERIVEQAKIHAKEIFNLNTPKEKQFYRMYMKDKGLPLIHLIVAEHWFELTFRSSVGEYSYTNLLGSYNYYDYMRYLLLALLIIGGLYTLFFMRLEGIVLFTLTVACAISLIGVSLYHSWTGDFQAQGRYLLPVVAMVSLFYYQCRNALNNVVMAGISGLLFIGSLYSFIFILIAGIEKLNLPFN